MAYNADSYAAMLLCLALSPDREEYAKPLNVTEYREIRQRAQSAALSGIGSLLGVDISGLMKLLRITEEEAYRIFLLLDRSVPLSYTMENFARREIRILTEFDRDYPERLRVRAGKDAPPVLYIHGDSDALRMPMLGILGNSGVKTTQDMLASLESLTLFAKENGYRLAIGGEFGVARNTQGLAIAAGCPFSVFCAGGMLEQIGLPESDSQLCTSFSLDHPEALFTLSHTISRNRLLFSLSDAAFVFNSDGKRGEAEALRNHRCDWIYAYSPHPSNHSLIAHGAIPFTRLDRDQLNEMHLRWRASEAEQISMFDL